MSSYFYSASQSCPIPSANCRYILRLFRLFRGIAQVWINLHRQNVFYVVMRVKGEPSLTLLRKYQEED